MPDPFVMPDPFINPAIISCTSSHAASTSYEAPIDAMPASSAVRSTPATSSAME
jgi:hypothetical protein